MEGIGCQCRDYMALAWNLCLTSRSFLLPFWFSCFVGINCHVGKIPMEGNGRLRLLDSQQGTEARSSTGCKELNPTMSLESDLARSLGFQKRPQLWPTPSFEASWEMLTQRTQWSCTWTPDTQKLWLKKKIDCCKPFRCVLILCEAFNNGCKRDRKNKWISKLGQIITQVPLVGGMWILSSSNWLLLRNV